MKLDEEIDKCLTNLANAVKALNIATQELHRTARRLETVKPPKLEIVKNNLGESLAKGLAEDKTEK